MLLVSLLLSAFCGSVAVAAEPDWTWVVADSKTDELLNAVVVGNDRYVAVGHMSTIRTSSDGLQWTEHPITKTSHLEDIVWGDTGFVAVGMNLSLRSADGENWTENADPDLGWLWRVGFGNGQYVASVLGGSGYSSADGNEWDELAGVSGQTNSFAYGRGVWLATTYENNYFTSMDGETWVEINTDTPYNSVTYVPELEHFVLVGPNGAISIGSDGVNWVSGIVDGDDSSLPAVNDVAYGDHGYVAVGENGLILTSIDGATWKRQDSGTSEDLRSVAFGPAGYVAVGSDGIILLGNPGGGDNGGGNGGENGDGSPENPYLVSDAKGLAAVANGLDKHYKLIADVDLSGELNWAPIGSENEPFVGVFDGNGKTIKSLALEHDDEFIGLFGVNNGHILNLNIEGFSVESDHQQARVGSLVGSNRAVIENVHVSSTAVTKTTKAANGVAYIGGLAGRNDGGIIDSSFSGTVHQIYEPTSSSSQDIVGGLVGLNTGLIANGSSTGEVSSANNIWGTGGLVGRNGGQIMHSLSTSKVEGVVAGGLVGVNLDGGSIDSSRAEGNVKASGDAGGLVGFNAGTIVTSSAGGTVTGSFATYPTYLPAGGLVGTNTGTVSHSYATGDVLEGVNIGGLVGFNDKGTVEDSYATGGLVKETRESEFMGVGGLVGRNEGTISRSYADRMVEGDNTTGGLVGYNVGGGTVEDSFARGTVSGAKSVGGLVGSNEAVIRRTYAAAIVSGTSQIGQLAGENSAGGQIEAVFWLAAGVPVEGVGVDDGTHAGVVKGLSAFEMKQASSFVGWDFVRVWGIEQGVGFPYLGDPGIVGYTLTLGNLEFEAGKSVIFTATLRDEAGQPVKNATVDFLLDDDFLGSAVSDELGVASLAYVGEKSGGVLQAIPPDFAERLVAPAKGTFSIREKRPTTDPATPPPPDHAVEPDPPTSAFNDTSGHWAEEELQVLKQFEVFHGYPDGSFKPENAVTIVELGAVLGRMADLTDLSGRDPGEVPVAAWAAEDVKRSVGLGIANSHEDWGAPATRAEVVLMLHRLVLLLQPDIDLVEYEWADELPADLLPAVNRLTQLGIVKGYPDGTFRGDNVVTRGELAALVTRTLELFGLAAAPVLD